METKEDSSTDHSSSDAEVPLAAQSAVMTLPSPSKKTIIKQKQEELLLQLGMVSDQSKDDGVVMRSLIKRKKENREMEKKIFGFELVLDLSDCDIEVMSSKKKLAEYVDKLCKLIDMKKYGKVQLPYFGLDKPQTKGYSLLQFIETSSITGHFSEYWRKSYINIFSCKPYDHKLAAKFTKEFFGAKRAKARFLVR